MVDVAINAEDDGKLAKHFSHALSWAVILARCWNTIIRGTWGSG
jgi:hypothetical protein